MCRYMHTHMCTYINKYIHVGINTYFVALFLVPMTASGLEGSQHLVPQIRYEREVGKLDP